MAQLTGDIRSIARRHTPLAIETLVSVCRDEDQPAAARVAAATHILDRGWGKPAQSITGENGEGAITVLIRHIVDGGDQLKQIEHVTKVTGE